MAARPLYELAAGFNALFDLVLDESMDLQLLEEGLQSIECALEEKCANGIALIKSLEAYAEAYSKEEKRFKAQRQILENRSNVSRSGTGRTSMRWGKPKFLRGTVS